MTNKEIEEIQLDVDDALTEFGTLDGAPLVTWYQRQHSEYNELYNEDVNPQFLDGVKIAAIVDVSPTEDKLSEIGMIGFGDCVLYVSEKEIQRKKTENVDNNFIGDQIEYRGIRYTIGKVTSAELASLDIMFTLGCTRLNIVLQPAETRDTADKLFETDASKPAEKDEPLAFDEAYK